jgi:hypothetical protein
MPGVDLNYFIRQANKLTQKLEQRRTELADETVEGQAGGGLVAVTATCARTIKQIRLDPKLLAEPDQAMLEDLIAAAVNAALSAAQERVDAELKKISGGVKIPGIT